MSTDTVTVEDPARSGQNTSSTMRATNMQPAGETLYVYAQSRSSSLANEVGMVLLYTASCVCVVDCSERLSVGSGKLQGDLLFFFRELLFLSFFPPVRRSVVTFLGKLLAAEVEKELLGINYSMRLIVSSVSHLKMRYKCARQRNDHYFTYC